MLLEDPEAKELLIEFFNQVLDTEMMEESVLDLTVKVLESSETRAVGLGIMKEIAQFCLKDRKNNDSSHLMAGGVANFNKMIEILELTKFDFKIKAKSPKLAQIPKFIDFNSIMHKHKADFDYLIIARDTKIFPYRKILRYRKFKNFELPKIKYFSPSRHMHKTCDILLDTYKKSQLPKHALSLSPQSTLLYLDSVEHLHINY